MKYIEYATAQEREWLAAMAEVDKRNSIERRRIWDRCRMRAIRKGKAK